MIQISCLRDLEKFGIITLTGEADSLGYRVLCDLKTYAVDLLAEVYGLRGKDAFAENWNSSQGQVASVMLDHDAWQTIAPIALIKCGCHTVFRTMLVTDAERKARDNPDIFEAIRKLRITQSIIGLQENAELIKAEWGDKDGAIVQVKPYRLIYNGSEQLWPEMHYGRIDRFFSHGSGPHIGTRNVHAMSGRVD